LHSVNYSAPGFFLLKTKKAMSSTSNKKGTVLDKICAAIRANQSAKGTSRVTIAKYLKSEFDYDNANALKKAFKKGVTDGLLVQEGQSFRVAADPIIEVNEPTVGIDDVKTGRGDDAKKGDTVVVAYRGTLDDGYVFDKADKFEFTLGAGDVIKGWDRGVVGMRKGGERKLTVPSELGYGKRGCKPDIPGNATLHFEITLKQIKKY
jgi:FKBP-type peptidyl-prolyl cis-trans isomerase